MYVVCMYVCMCLSIYVCSMYVCMYVCMYVQWKLDLTNLDLTPELLGITNNIFVPGKSYSKMYGTEPRFNELLDLTNRFRQPKLRIYLQFTSI